MCHLSLLISQTFVPVCHLVITQQLFTGRWGWTVSPAFSKCKTPSKMPEQFFLPNPNPKYHFLLTPPLSFSCCYKKIFIFTSPYSAQRFLSKGSLSTIPSSLIVLTTHLVFCLHLPLLLAHNFLQAELCHAGNFLSSFLYSLHYVLYAQYLKE